VGGGVFTDKERKVFKLRDGFLYGYAGGVEDGERLKRALRSGQEPPQLTDIQGLLISPGGDILLYEGNTWVKQKEPYYAIGSGAIIALVAMDCGKDAITAVKMGIKRDNGSGGRVLHVRLEKEKKVARTKAGSTSGTED
jgi:hypothetical protein